MNLDNIKYPGWLAVVQRLYPHVLISPERVLGPSVTKRLADKEKRRREWIKNHPEEKNS